MRQITLNCPYTPPCFVCLRQNPGQESGPTRAFRSVICEGLRIPYSSPDQVAGCIKWRHQQVTSLEVARRSWEAEEDRRSRIEAQLWTLLLVFTRIRIICRTREVFIMIYVEMIADAEVWARGNCVRTGSARMTFRSVIAVPEF